uniref:C2H2-type domain-containing protein n=1 Tax=Solanum tuberosum TaxID=4113 RepID=M1D951_SOLTU
MLEKNTDLPLCKTQKSVDPSPPLALHPAARDPLPVTLMNQSYAPSDTSTLSDQKFVYEDLDPRGTDLSVPFEMLRTNPLIYEPNPKLGSEHAPLQPEKINEPDPMLGSEPAPPMLGSEPSPPMLIIEPDPALSSYQFTHRLHSGISFNYLCYHRQCTGVYFNSPHGIVFHNLHSHPDFSHYCVLCGTAYNTSGDLSLHVAEVHHRHHLSNFFMEMESLLSF